MPDEKYQISPNRSSPIRSSPKRFSKTEKYVTLRFDSDEEDLVNDTTQWPERSYNLDKPIHKGANRFNFYHHRARKAK